MATLTPRRVSSANSAFIIFRARSSIKNKYPPRSARHPSARQRRSIRPGRSLRRPGRCQSRRRHEKHHHWRPSQRRRSSRPRPPRPRRQRRPSPAHRCWHARRPPRGGRAQRSGQRSASLRRRRPCNGVCAGTGPTGTARCRPGSAAKRRHGHHDDQLVAAVGSPGHPTTTLPCMEGWIEQW